MSESVNNPFEDAPLAEAWNAFSQLARSAEAPFDEAAFAEQMSARLALEIERDRRRRRLWMGASALAMAASLLAIVGLYQLLSRHSSSAPTPLPEQEVAIADVAPAPAVQAGAVDVDAVVVENAPAPSVSIAPWDDELAAETASLADEMQSLERQWRERPDSIALLQTQIDQFEQEIKSGEL
jgi:hypothetical protein